MSQHFNGLTPAEAERLALLAEECGEVIQLVGKILRHGYESHHPDDDETNRRRLEVELGDLAGAVTLMIQGGDVNSTVINEFSSLKVERVRRWLHHQ